MKDDEIVYWTIKEQEQEKLKIRQQTAKQKNKEFVKTLKSIQLRIQLPVLTLNVNNLEQYMDCVMKYRQEIYDYIDKQIKQKYLKNEGDEK